MTSTPYKDELIRVAMLLGLPDDVDLTTVADTLAGRLEEADAAGRRAEAELSIRHAAEADRNRYQTALRSARTALERQADGLLVRRERAKSAQAFADMTELGEEARMEATRATAVLEG